jgi:hypothetical protein
MSRYITSFFAVFFFAAAAFANGPDVRAGGQKISDRGGLKTNLPFVERLYDGTTFKEYHTLVGLDSQLNLICLVGEKQDLSQAQIQKMNELYQQTGKGAVLSSENLGANQGKFWSTFQQLTQNGGVVAVANITHGGHDYIPGFGSRIDTFKKMFQMANASGTTLILYDSSCYSGNAANDLAIDKLLKENPQHILVTGSPGDQMSSTKTEGGGRVNACLDEFGKPYAGQSIQRFLEKAMGRKTMPRIKTGSGLDQIIRNISGSWIRNVDTYSGLFNQLRSGIF